MTLDDGTAVFVLAIWNVVKVTVTIQGLFCARVRKSD